MEFTEVIRRRRMIRAFTPEPLPGRTADRLLSAAVRAPSAGFCAFAKAKLISLDLAYGW